MFEWFQQKKAKFFRKKRQKTLLQQKKQESKQVEGEKQQIRKLKRKLGAKDPFYLGMMFRFLKPEMSKEDRTYHVFAVVLIILFFILFIILFFTPFFRLDTIQVKIQHQALLQEKTLESKLQTFRGNLLFFLSLGEIESILLKQFQEIRQIQCQKSFPRTLLCEAEEHKTKLLVLKGDKKDIEYLVNEAGQVVAQRPYSPHPELLRVKLAGNISMKKGEKLLDPQILEFLYHVKNEIEGGFGFGVKDMWWLYLEREVHVFLTVGTKIIFTFERNAEQQLSDFSALFNQGQFDLKTIQYIDLRVPSKIFVK